MNRIQPLLRASQHATSSRVTLDALASLPARSFATTATAQAVQRRRAAEVEVEPLRWAPESPEPFRNSSGLADRAPTHTLTIAASNNNVILSFTDRIGPLVPNTTAGQGKKFKNAQRGTYEAAHQATVRMIEQIKRVAEEFRERQEQNPDDAQRMYIRVAFKGLFGFGRDAAATALGGPEGADIRNIITRIEDRTPIKIGGTRARRRRRV